MSKTDTPAPNTPGQTPSMEQIKAGMRATWMSGNFGKIAEYMQGIAEEFAKRVAPKAGARVLDVACGSGNVTLLLARMGVMVTGIDIAPNLLEEARKRAEDEHLDITFDEGDAEALPYPDGSFDVVTSMFGAMFAPRPELVTKEMARVLTPGGKIAMANWTPDSFTASVFRTTSKHAPPTPGIQSPLLWGEEKTVHTRLSDGFEEVMTEAIPINFEYPMSPKKASALFREYYGPTRTAFSKLDEKGKDALGSDLDLLWSGACVARTPADSSRPVSESEPTETLIHNKYLLVTATRAE